MERVTIKDVARAAGVSYATVSRALSGSALIAEKTRARIAQTAQEMGYTANSVARAMVKKRTGMIGLIVPGIDDPVTAELVSGTEEHAREYGFSLLLGCSGGDTETEAQLFLRMTEQQADGVLIVPSGPNTYAHISHLACRMPSVFVAEELTSEEASGVLYDDMRGAALGAKYLFSLGHRSVLFLRSGAQQERFSRREAGYCTACRAQGVVPQVRSIALAPEAEVSIQALAAFLFDTPPTFSAIFAESDALALSVMAAAAARDIEIPMSMSLLGYGNAPLAALPMARLTTVEQNQRTLSLMAVEMLVRRMRDAAMDDTRRVLKPALVLRSTCCPPTSTGRKAESI